MTPKITEPTTMDKEKWRDHIRSVCQMMGEYNGGHHDIALVGDEWCLLVCNPDIPECLYKSIFLSPIIDKFMEREGIK